MSKIIATLTVLSLFVSVAYSTTYSSQSGSLASSLLNSMATKVYGANSTGYDLTIWQAGTIPYTNVIFGPATTNATLYAYGYITATAGSLTVYKRTVNATIVGFGNDTTETSYIASDATITATIGATNTPTVLATAVAPGYLAILSVNSDATPYSQVFLTIVTGTSQTTKTITANAATTLTYSSAIGSIFYDPGSTAFFYTFAGISGSTSPYTITINAGGYFAAANGSYFAANSYSITAGTAYTSTTAVTNLVIGPDNFTSASNIYVAYKDGTAAISYFSKTSKAMTTTALGSASSLVADSTAASNTTTYLPIGVWASNVTYGISAALKSVGTSATTYTVANFYNGTTSGVLSGIELSSATGQALSVAGWELNTGYTLLAKWPTSTSYQYTYTFGQFFANASANGTMSTLASALDGPLNTFEDVNGTEWVGWTDVVLSSTPAPTFTYNGYLAKLQGQLNPATSSSFADALKCMMAFVAFCLAAVFAF